MSDEFQQENDMETQNAARTDTRRPDLRQAIERAGAEEAQRREADQRLTPRITRLPDGRFVFPVNSITEGIAMLAAPVMVDLLLRSAVALSSMPKEAPGAFELSAEIASCLRQINPDHPE